MKIIIPASFNLNKKETKALADIVSGEYGVDNSIVEKLLKLKLIMWSRSMAHCLRPTKEGKMLMGFIEKHLYVGKSKTINMTLCDSYRGLSINDWN